ncbi:MAG: hypothetical protein Q4G68_08955 [Planctomycetia bacterium]|nr:hypothetical protein [Planctomycetia bacterium]
MARIKIWMTMITFLILTGTSQTIVCGQASNQALPGERAPYYFQNAPQPADVRFVLAPDKRLFKSESPRGQAGSQPSAQSILTRYLTGQYPPEMLNWYVQQHKQQTSQAAVAAQRRAPQPASEQVPGQLAAADQPRENRMARMTFSLGRKNHAITEPATVAATTAPSSKAPSSKAIFAQLFTGRRTESVSAPAYSDPAPYAADAPLLAGNSTNSAPYTAPAPVVAPYQQGRMFESEQTRLAYREAEPGQNNAVFQGRDATNARAFVPDARPIIMTEEEETSLAQAEPATSGVRLVSGTITHEENELRDSTRVWRPGDSLSQPATKQTGKSAAASEPPAPEEDGWRPVP